MSPSYLARVDAVFLDYEGTLNDSMQSGRLYAAELAGFLGRKFGDHRSANYGRGVIAAMEATRTMPDQFTNDNDWPGYAEYRRRELRLWLRTLLGTAGLPVPSEDDAADALIADLVRNVTPRFVPTPGAMEALQGLSGADLRIYVSSGATSEYTARCLRDAGLIGLFDGVFGPDKLDTLKNGAAYYARCFSAAGVDSSRACIVDDSPGPLRWALELGARAIGLGVAAELVIGDGLAHVHTNYTVIRNLGELTDVLGLVNV